MLYNYIKNNKVLFSIILIGTILRILFLIFGAEIYFDRENIFIDGDTGGWQKCIENLIHNGTYTVGSENGQFSRMPGYSFFIGQFFYLFFKNWDLASIFIGLVSNFFRYILHLYFL